MKKVAWLLCLSIFILGGVLLSPSSYAAEFSDKEFCKAMTDLMTNINKDAGQMVDATTRNDGGAVLCNSKIVDYKKFLKAPSTAMREGWKERKNAQWNEIYCKGPFLDAIRNGWTISTTLTTIDGDRTWIKANCK